MIGHFFGVMADVMLVAAVLVFAFLSVVALMQKRSKHTKPNWPRIIFLALFFSYLAGLFSLTLELPYLFVNGPAFDLVDYNIVPFRQISHVIGRLALTYARVNFWGNIVIFAPIGFAVPLLKVFQRSFLAGILWTSAVSLFIELFQIMTPRTTDIDDIILNTLGGLLGAAIYVLFQKLFPAADKCLKPPIAVKK